MKKVLLILIILLSMLSIAGCLKTFDVSPDGKKVVYIESEYSKPKGGIFLYNLGSKQRIPIETGFRDMYFYPSFSPDGKKIAYIKLHEELLSWNDKKGPVSAVKIGLWISNLDGKEKQEIAPLLQNLPEDFWKQHGVYAIIYLLTLSWSPDSKDIVYSDIGQLYNREVPKKESMKISIYKVNIESKEAIHLTSEEDGVCQYPVYSPNGEEILFTKGFVLESETGPLESGIYAMDTVGLAKREILKTIPQIDKKYVMGPANWSPDGEEIAFSLTTVDWKGSKICTVNKDGGEIKEISSPGNWANPKWSPDGKKLIWEHGFEQNAVYDILVGDLEGRILAEFKDGIGSQWQKDSKHILYVDSSEEGLRMANISDKSSMILVDSYKSMDKKAEEFIKNGNGKEALAIYEDMLLFHESVVNNVFDKAMIVFLNRNDFKGAITWGEKNISKDRSLNTKESFTEICVSGGEYKKGIKYYQEALAFYQRKIDKGDEQSKKEAEKTSGRIAEIEKMK